MESSMKKVNLQMSESLISIDELSKRLGVSINTLYSWANQRKIPFFKLGRLLRFNWEDIQVWLEQKKVNPNQFDESKLAR